MDNKIIAWVQIRKFVTRFMLFIAVVTLLCIGVANSGDTFAKEQENITVPEVGDCIKEI